MISYIYEPCRCQSDHLSLIIFVDFHLRLLPVLLFPLPSCRYGILQVYEEPTSPSPPKKKEWAKLGSAVPNFSWQLKVCKIKLNSVSVVIRMMMIWNPSCKRMCLNVNEERCGEKVRKRYIFPSQETGVCSAFFIPLLHFNWFIPLEQYQL